jgi:hypothetical protein
VSQHAAELAALDRIAWQVAAADQQARVWRDERDVLVVALARAGVAHGLIAAAAHVSQQAVSKIARAAGVRRYGPQTDSDGPPPPHTTGSPGSRQRPSGEPEGRLDCCRPQSLSGHGAKDQPGFPPPRGGNPG